MDGIHTLATNNVELTEKLTQLKFIFIKHYKNIQNSSGVNFYSLLTEHLM